MLKIKSGLHLSLPKLCLLGLAKLLILSMLDVHPATGQTVSYSCQLYQGNYTTLGRGTVGVLPVIIWENRQVLCNTVSTRFQVARDNGNLRFLVKEENRVCGTDRNGGECRNLLFATDSEINADLLWRRLRSNVPITMPDSTYITQSNGREYFNLELYLQTTPIEKPMETLPSLQTSPTETLPTVPPSPSRQ